uniref:Uncharacterized protein n=1 Tax=Mantoniella antarctica TaxID=81844 RepID=A0A7S0X9U3_9CHLO
MQTATRPWSAAPLRCFGDGGGRRRSQPDRHDGCRTWVRVRSAGASPPARTRNGVRSQCAPDAADATDDWQDSAELASTSQSEPADDVIDNGEARFGAILATLCAAPLLDFPAAVVAVREELTVSFYEFAAERVGELETSGEKEAAAKLDELCGRVMATADRTFGTLTASIGDESDDRDGTGGLSLAAEQQVQKRWDAISAKLAMEGEGQVIVQAEKNAKSRRDSVTAIIGRVPLGPREMRSLNMVTAERRIIDVLLAIPRGPERSDTLTDALTPPPQAESTTSEEKEKESPGASEADVDEESDTDEGSSSGDVDASRAKAKQLDIEDDMLVGDEEEVSTSPARLLMAVELAIKEARKAGDDAAVIDELQSLRIEVAGRCDFL